MLSQSGQGDFRQAPQGYPIILDNNGTMKITASKEGEYTVISPTGEVDLHHSPMLRERVLRHIAAGESVLIDLSQVNYLDSSGIASLVEGYQKSRNAGLRFGLVGVGEPVMQVLQLARLDRVFPIHADAAERAASDDRQTTT